MIKTLLDGTQFYTKHEIEVLVIRVNQIIVNMKSLLNFVPGFAVQLHAIFPVKLGRVLVLGSN